MLPSSPFRIVSSCFLSLLLTQSVWGQKDAGSIAGTVKDASGATIPEAKVTITEVDKGTSLITSTGSSGDYVVSPLLIGHYSVKVEKSGFKTAITEAIELQVQERAVVDITMQVGAIAEQITVNNVAPLLETETSELGQVVDNRRVVNLPLNGQNFAQLAQLSAGVAPSEPGARNSGSYGFSSNGGRSYQNNILLDGIDNNSNLTDLLTFSFTFLALSDRLWSRLNWVDLTHRISGNRVRRNRHRFRRCLALLCRGGKPKSE